MVEKHILKLTKNEVQALHDLIENIDYDYYLIGHILSQNASGVNGEWCGKMIEEIMESLAKVQAKLVNVLGAEEEENEG